MASPLHSLQNLTVLLTGPSPSQSPTSSSSASTWLSKWTTRVWFSKEDDTKKTADEPKQQNEPVSLEGLMKLLLDIQERVANIETRLETRCVAAETHSLRSHVHRVMVGQCDFNEYDAGDEGEDMAAEIEKAFDEPQLSSPGTPTFEEEYVSSDGEFLSRPTSPDNESEIHFDYPERKRAGAAAANCAYDEPQWLQYTKELGSSLALDDFLGRLPHSPQTTSPYERVLEYVFTHDRETNDESQQSPYVWRRDLPLRSRPASPPVDDRAELERATGMPIEDFFTHQQLSQIYKVLQSFSPPRSPWDWANLDTIEEIVELSDDSRPCSRSSS